MKTVFSALLLLCAASSYAQTRISDHNNIGWASISVSPAISKKFSGHAEYQWRRVNLVEEWQQSLLRVGINYKINSQVKALAGYAWVETFPYGAHTIARISKTFPEHRIFEQMIV